MIYLDNRCFLPSESSLRKDTSRFPIKAEELRPPPPTKNYSDMKAYHQAYEKTGTYVY